MKTPPAPFVPGLVSITFRQLGFAEIIGLVWQAGLRAIEWGGARVRRVRVWRRSFTTGRSWIHNESARALLFEEAVHLNLYSYWPPPVGMSADG